MSMLYSACNIAKDGIKEFKPKKRGVITFVLSNDRTGHMDLWFHPHLYHEFAMWFYKRFQFLHIEALDIEKSEHAKLINNEKQECRKWIEK
jgi:hypothetical protein